MGYIYLVQNKVSGGPFEGSNEHSYFRNRRRIYEQLSWCQLVKENVAPSSYTVALVKMESLLHFQSLFFM